MIEVEDVIVAQARLSDAVRLFEYFLDLAKEFPDASTHQQSRVAGELADVRARDYTCVLNRLSETAESTIRQATMIMRAGGSGKGQ